MAPKDLKIGERGVARGEGRWRQHTEGVRGRMLGWWYVCIGGAFVLLGFRSAVRGDPGWSVVFRFVIAAGFAALGAGTLRGRRP